MKTDRTHPCHRLAVMALLSFSLMGMGSCSRTVAEVCAQDIPQFETSLNQVSVALNEVASGRRLASESKEDWTGWAEQYVKVIQKWIDVIEPHSELMAYRNQLNDVATELVMFYGYAEKSDRARMSLTLGKARTEMAELRSTLCLNSSQ